MSHETDQIIRAFRLWGRECPCLCSRCGDLAIALGVAIERQASEAVVVTVRATEEPRAPIALLPGGQPSPYSESAVLQHGRIPWPEEKWFTGNTRGVACSHESASSSIGEGWRCNACGFLVPCEVSGCDEPARHPNNIGGVRVQWLCDDHTQHAAVPVPTPIPGLGRERLPG